MLFVVLTIANLLALSQAGNLLQRSIGFLEGENFGYSAPYAFAYNDGQSAREESSDGNGGVRGSYQISTPEGTRRNVRYIADAAGFRAEVDTNEPGTESKSPADVAFISSQPSAEEISLRYGPAPALLNANLIPRTIGAITPSLLPLEQRTIGLERSNLLLGSNLGLNNLHLGLRRFETPIGLNTLPHLSRSLPLEHTNYANFLHK